MRNRKHAIFASAVAMSLIAPIPSVEAKGLRIDLSVVGIPVVINPGNKHPFQTPSAPAPQILMAAGIFVPIISDKDIPIILGGSPDLLALNLFTGGISNWWNAPKDIRKSIDDAAGSLNKNIILVKEMMEKNIQWFKGFIEENALKFVLIIGASIVLSGCLGATILGLLLRRGFVGSKSS